MVRNVCDSRAANTILKLPPDPFELLDGRGILLKDALFLRQVLCDQRWQRRQREMRISKQWNTKMPIQTAMVAKPVAKELKPADNNGYEDEPDQYPRSIPQINNKAKYARFKKRLIESCSP